MVPARRSVLLLKEEREEAGQCFVVVVMRRCYASCVCV